MRVTICQPDVFPPLYVLNRWAQSDLVVILDTAQFTRSGRHHKYILPTGLTLTVPVQHHGRFAFLEGRVDYTHRWVKKHLSSIRQAYPKAGACAFRLIERALIDAPDLSHLAMQTAELLKSTFGGLPRLRRASTLASGTPIGDPTGWMIAICREVGADRYIGPKLSDGPHNRPQDFEAAGIEYFEQHWDPPFDGYLWGMHAVIDPGLDYQTYWAYLAAPSLKPV